MFSLGRACSRRMFISDTEAAVLGYGGPVECFVSAIEALIKIFGCKSHLFTFSATSFAVSTFLLPSRS